MVPIIQRMAGDLLQTGRIAALYVQNSLTLSSLFASLASQLPMFPAFIITYVPRSYKLFCTQLFHHLRLDGSFTEYLFELLMELWGILCCIIGRGQQGLPFTIHDKQIVVITAWEIADVVVCILHAHLVIGQGTLVITIHTYRNPDTVLFAV